MAYQWASTAVLASALIGVACSANNENDGATPFPPAPGAGSSSVVGGSSSATQAGGSSAGTTSVGGAGVSAGTGGTAGVGGVVGGTGGVGASGPIDVGTKVIHRLSNVEYDNTVQSLLGTTKKFGNDFVHEEAEGFDNIAEALSMSPRQAEDYFAAARELAAEVFADPSLRGRIVTCTPDAADATCARTIIANFGRRAFRRPLESSEEQWLLSAYQAAQALGESPLGAVQHVVHLILSAPQFLYRIEFDPDPASATPHPLNAYELASRLSYALWSSMPDEGLFSLAATGELSNENTLRAQVDTMLADSRSDMLIKNFAAQWIGIRRLAEHAVSPTVYPEWSSALSSSALREMELYFGEFLYNDRPYTEFLTADFNFVDEALAQHYGMTPPAQSGFSRVENTTDQRRGAIGLAGFLTQTSRETRSSPIIRGSAILDAFLCLKLHLPPDLVVEPLPEPAEGDAPTTVRELIAAHRSAASCSPCHNLIDPIGLSLEHFDGIGRYRAVYENGLAIDAKGVLPSGAEVDSLISLSGELAKDPNFLPCAAKKLNTYALGRASADQGALTEIVQKWTAGTPTLRNLIKETVSHVTFTQRHPEAP